jgi:signal transduction histidine kinase
LQTKTQSGLAAEQAMAIHVAIVRLLLAAASLIVVILDWALPALRTLASHKSALLASGLLVLYAGLMYLALRADYFDVEKWYRVSAALDVLFGGGLILGTEGYESPFTIWLVIAVVASATSGQRLLPWTTALLGLLAHCLIAFIPQVEPLDKAIFIVRTGFLFGVAGVLSTIGTYQSRQSLILASLEEIGRRLSDARTRRSACETLLEVIMARLRPDGASVTLSDGESIDSGDIDQSPLQCTVILSAGGRSFGTLRVWRPSALARSEDSVVRLCCDRAASALLRIDLSESLVRSAAAAERLRVSDHLHDTYVQTLAAIDLRTAAVVQHAAATNDPSEGELREIKDLIRVAGRQAREITEILCNPLPPGPDAVRSVLSERWLGDSDVEIAADLELSDERWRVVEMFVREGLNNVAKHATKARKIILRIAKEHGRTICTLSDDGAKFTAPVRLGHGLSRLTQIVEQQGGRLSFGPVKSRGAVLRAEFEGMG